MTLFRSSIEAANFSDWDGWWADDGIFMERTKDAAYPHRGAYGLRVTCYTNYRCGYLWQELNKEIAPQETIYFSFALRFPENPEHIVRLLEFKDDNWSWSYTLYLLPEGKLWHLAMNDGGSATGKVVDAVITGEPHWINIAVWRASADGAEDGGCRAWIDGVSETDYLDNLSNYGAVDLIEELKFGVTAYSCPGFVVDLDELYVGGKPVRPPLPVGKVWK